VTKSERNLSESDIASTPDLLAYYGEGKAKRVIKDLCEYFGIEDIPAIISCSPKIFALLFSTERTVQSTIGPDTTNSSEGSKMSILNLFFQILTNTQRRKPAR